MKKILKLIAAALAAFVFIGTLVFLYLNGRAKPVEYLEVQPMITDIVNTTVVTGKIEPRNGVNIKPQISGIITQINKEAGQMVKAGEIIAKVKVVPDMNQLSSAESRVRLAQINVKQAEVNYNREKVLYEKGLVSAEEYDKLKQSFRQASEEVKAARDQLEVVKNGVSQINAGASSTLIRSTITGLILDIPVQVGNSVILSNTFNDGTTIATVADMTNLIFKGNIDETEVGRLVTGMPMTITVGALKNLVLKASLEYVSPKSVESNGTNQFEIKAAVKLHNGATIRSGYSANAQIVLARADKVLAIPESTIEFVGDESFVYVVKGDKDAKQYERRKIITGLSDGMNIEVKSGLRRGEIIRGAKKE